MAPAKVADFSGWATKANLQCSDGRTITPQAFQHMDGKTVPLVWQHGHSNVENVLGYAILEHRDQGVYAYGYFNGTPPAEHAKALVQHGDITMMSIFANKLQEKAKQVLHGVIREVSLVLSGANPGALIDDVVITHADGEDEITDAAYIFTGDDNIELVHAEGEVKTVRDVYDSLDEEQKKVVLFMIGAAIEAEKSVKHDDTQDDDDPQDDSESEKDEDDDTTDEDTLNHQEGQSMNVFEKDSDAPRKSTLTHTQLMTIVDDAKKMGSFKESLLAHAGEYGIGEIELLFPDAKNVTNTPEFVKRRTEWVNQVISDTKHSPFSRIKSLHADITADEARAKGYLKGNMKKEEFFALTKRTTTPTTVYKKQKLDRDDMIDITDFDVVQWLWTEMRLMLDEEIAGAVLFGDGRPVDDPDHVQDPQGASSGPGIRSIAHEHEFYAPRVQFDSSVEGWKPDDLIDSVVDALSDYEGSGSPTLYTTTRRMNRILLQKDTLGRRLYANRSEVAQLMGVSRIVDVPESVIGRAEGVAGIIVNLNDYTLGTDAGGQIAKFDDFDIDYNQYKYLLEGRSSGALTKYRSAVVLVDGPVETEPVAP